MLSLSEFLGVKEEQEFLLTKNCLKCKIINNKLIRFCENNGQWLPYNPSIKSLLESGIIILNKSFLTDDEKEYLRNLINEFERKYNNKIHSIAKRVDIFLGIDRLIDFYSDVEPTKCTYFMNKDEKADNLLFASLQIDTIYTLEELGL